MHSYIPLVAVHFYSDVTKALRRTFCFAIISWGLINIALIDHHDGAGMYVVCHVL